MSVDQSNSFTFSLGRIIRSSHRTLPEQSVGLGIYLLLCLGAAFLGGFQASPAEMGLHIVYSLSLAFSMWTLWRRYSLRVLKLELSVFLAQFFFQAFWSISHLFLRSTLLSLVALLLLWSTTLLAALLFWKKERLSGALLFFPVLWIFYLIGLNMLICISNP